MESFEQVLMKGSVGRLENLMANKTNSQGILLGCAKYIKKIPFGLNVSKLENFIEPTIAMFGI